MKYTILALGVAASLVVAQSDSTDGPLADPLHDVCYPQNATGFPDTNAPCNVAELIQAECTYGQDFANTLLNPSDDDGLTKRAHLFRRSDDDDGDLPDPLSNSTQQVCFCESQFFDELTGCSDCFVAHGDPSDDGLGVGSDFIKSFSSAYCAATATPVALVDFLISAIDSVTSTASIPTATSSFHDPLGNRTQVSLYFTPQVTGTAAWMVGSQPTDGSATAKPSVSTDKGGEIVPTQSPNNPDATTGGAAAAITQGAAAAGLIGFAGLIALL